MLKKFVLEISSISFHATCGGPGNIKLTLSNVKLTIINKNIDLLLIFETKIDSSFPSVQFPLEGYATPHRLDRNSKWCHSAVYKGRYSFSITKF